MTLPHLVVAAAAVAVSNWYQKSEVEIRIRKNQRPAMLSWLSLRCELDTCAQVSTGMKCSYASAPKAEVKKTQSEVEKSEVEVAKRSELENYGGLSCVLGQVFK